MNLIRHGSNEINLVIRNRLLYVQISKQSLSRKFTCARICLKNVASSSSYGSGCGGFFIESVCGWQHSAAQSSHSSNYFSAIIEQVKSKHDHHKCKEQYNHSEQQNEEAEPVASIMVKI